MEMESIAAFWSASRAALGPGAPEQPPPSWSFGDSPELADELLALVMDGRKTATCDSVWAYEAAGEPLPQPGDLSIVLDGRGAPACVIETTEVRIMPMNEVDAQFAYDEGEGDRSYENWRQGHLRFFTRACKELGCTFDESMPVVAERFRVVYRE